MRDLRHTADVDRVQVSVCSREWHASLGPPSRASGLGPRPRTPQPGPHLEPRRQNKKRGTAVHPGRTPLPDTHHDVILCPLPKGGIKAKRRQEKARRPRCRRGQEWKPQGPRRNALNGSDRRDLAVTQVTGRAGSGCRLRAPFYGSGCYTFYSPRLQMARSISHHRRRTRQRTSATGA